MSIFTTRQELSPLTPSDSEASQRVLRTHELLGLDDNQMMLVGSAAAALYGIYLESEDLVGEMTSPRPADLDFATSPLYMDSLYDPLIDEGKHTTPNGLRLTQKDRIAHRVGLHIETPVLPVDLLSGFRDDGRGGLQRFDERFRKYLGSNSRPIENSSLRVITLAAMREELATRAKLDPKARKDLAYLRVHTKK